MTVLEAICLRCDRRQRPCVKACRCEADGQDIAVHVAERVCPLGKFVEGQAVEVGRGAGTELARLLAWWGIGAEATCSCKARAAQMDSLGVEWCEANKQAIIDWLEEEAKRRGQMFHRVLAFGVVTLAIARARQAGG